MTRITNIKQWKEYNKANIGKHYTFFEKAENLVGTLVYPVCRTITHAQSNSFAMTSLRNNKESSWLDYPKAKEVTFIQEENRTIIRVFNPVMNTYLFYATQMEQ